MDANTFHTLRTAYTANLIAAEPEVPLAEISVMVAALILRYAAAVDPGVYAYYPHPYTVAEATLYSAAASLVAA